MDTTQPDGDSIAPADTMIGCVLSNTYRIDALLDEGGMGRVYRATHLRLNRPVAVKVMRASGTRRMFYATRFRAEVEIISELQHPHIVSVVDFDTTNEGAPYLVMELLHGETLSTRLMRRGPLAMGEAVRMVFDAATALSAAHAIGIVHRDLKPDNLFLVDLGDEPPFVKLLDFGIGKRLYRGRPITGAYEVLGTPVYMAPEQAAGEEVDARADQYALGAISFEMLTGRRCVAADNIAEALSEVLRLPAPRVREIVPDIPLRIDQAIARALSKDPRDRFPSVLDFALALSEPCGGAESVIAAIDRARRYADQGAWLRAATYVLHALQLTDRLDDPNAAAVVALSDRLIERILLMRLGGPEARLALEREPAVGDTAMSPEVVFLASRVASSIVVAELLDVSPLSPRATLRALCTLVDMGICRTSRSSPR